MAQEIERKFLVIDERWRVGQPTTIRQGYLSVDPERTVRVRTKAGPTAARAYVTIKGKSEGTARAEYEYEIPVTDGDELLDRLCLTPLIEKDRYTVEYEGMTWEIDEFFGENQGLVVAEIELTHIDQPFAKPPWLGDDVSHDHRYFNASLSQHPYQQWVKA